MRRPRRLGAAAIAIAAAAIAAQALVLERPAGLIVPARELVQVKRSLLPAPAIVRARSIREASFLPGMAGVAGYMAASGEAFGYSYLSQQSSDTDGSSFTLTFGSFGAVDANRYLIAGIQSADNASTTTISTVTIGGVSASSVHSRNDSTNRAIAALYIAAVPTGTSGDVVVTFGGSRSNCKVSLWRAILPAGPTAADTDGDNGASSPLAGELGIDIASGGFAVACFAELGFNGSFASGGAASTHGISGTGLVISVTFDGGSASWSNATEDDDTASFGGGGSTTNRAALVIASWNP